MSSRDILKDQTLCLCILIFFRYLIRSSSSHIIFFSSMFSLLFSLAFSSLSRLRIFVSYRSSISLFLELSLFYRVCFSFFGPAYIVSLFKCHSAFFVFYVYIISILCCKKVFFIVLGGILWFCIRISRYSTSTFHIS